MRITLVSTFYPPLAFGGDAVHVHGLAAGLAARGNAVRVVHTGSAFRLLATVAPLSGYGPIDGVEVIDLDIGRPALVGTYITSKPVGYSAKLAAALDGSDVVHFHNPSLLGGVGGIRCTNAIRMYTAHEHWLLCPMHTLFRNNAEVCTQRTCIRCCASYRRPPQPWRWTDAVDRAVAELDVLICPSRFTAALHEARYPNANVRVVTPPGPRRVERSLASAPNEGRPFVLFVGRLQAIKGALWMAKSLQNRTTIDVVFAGDGPERNELERVAAADPHLKVVGQQSREEVMDLVESATAVVIPSLGYETFGGVGREAMSVGTPIVVRALGPLPELIEHGGGVSFSNAQELCEIVERLSNDAAWTRALRLAVPTVASNDDHERFFDEYFALIEQAARRRGEHELAAAAERQR